jgi:hypothetical protein
MCEISKISLINLNNKVVWEMLICYLSHFSLFMLQDPWCKPKKNENNLGLLSKRDRSMTWVWVSTELIVHIVIFQRVDDIFNQDSINIEATKVVHWILRWDLMATYSVFIFVEDSTC